MIPAPYPDAEPADFVREYFAGTFPLPYVVHKPKHGAYILLSAIIGILNIHDIYKDKYHNNEYPVHRSETPQCHATKQPLPRIAYQFSIPDENRLSRAPY